MYIELLHRPLKQQLAQDIADHFGLGVVTVSNGATIVSDFLDKISIEISGAATGQSDSYRKAEHVLNLLGLVYDPWWDSSEARGKTGGGTVTARAYSRMRGAILGIERYFLIPANVARASDGTLISIKNPTGNPLAEAGPGSRLLFIEKSGSEYVATGTGTVTSTLPGWEAPWKVDWDFALFPEGKVFTRASRLPSGIREITNESFSSFEDITGVPDSIERDITDRTVSRIASEFPVGKLAFNRIHVPEASHDLSAASDLIEPSYGDETKTSVGTDIVFRRPKNRAAMRLIEQRAIEITQRALVVDGWKLARDCQKDGNGFDLLFEKDGRELRVEVKGIQGSRLEFNLTPKEWWRALTDPDWVVIAVNNALSPTVASLTLLTGSQVRQAQRSVVSYRVRPLISDGHTR